MEIRQVTDAVAAEVWRAVHNLVIPPSPLSPDDMRDRLSRNHLSLAYVDDVLVGNATIRPAAQGAPPTVIVRVLPEHRRRGYGTHYFQQLLTDHPDLGRCDIATVVLTANTDGLTFAERHGFTEVDRYEVHGAQYLDLIRRT